MSSSSRYERLARRAVLALLRGAMSRRRHWTKLTPADLSRVLLMRYDRIGDAVITTPLIAALKHIAPQVEIDVLASPSNAVIFRNDPRISEVHLWPRAWHPRLQSIMACRRRRYDAVFQLILNRTTLPSLLAAVLAPGAHIIGKAAPGREALLDHAISLPGDMHFADRTFGLIEAGIDLGGNGLAPFPYSLMIPEETRDGVRRYLNDRGLYGKEFIVVNISASKPTRELTDEQNVALASALATDHLVAISSAPDALERAGRIAEQAGEQVQAVSFPSLLSLAAALAEDRLVVTPDTSVVHIASAVGSPVVALFARPGDPTGWRPRGVPHRIVQAKRGESMSEVDVGEVIEAAREVLSVEC